jgi:uncharacterized membrane protein YdbT with pleckstrin-like domain
MIEFIWNEMIIIIIIIIIITTLILKYIIKLISFIFYFWNFILKKNEKNYLFILFWIAVQWIDNDQGI